MSGTFGGCATCEGECCRRYLVPVTVADLRGIAAATTLPPTDFVDLRSIPLRTTGFRLVAAGPPLHLVMAKSPPTGEPRGACVFLMDLPSGSARCGIYAHRPSACRTFPTVLRMGTGAVRPGIVCGPDAWNISTMDLPAFRRDLKAQTAAWIETEAIAVSWNRMVEVGRATRQPADLFRYLLSADLESDAASDLRRGRA